jgi:hypothetical protein
MRLVACLPAQEHHQHQQQTSAEPGMARDTWQGAARLTAVQVVLRASRAMQINHAFDWFLVQQACSIPSCAAHHAVHLTA